MNKETFAEKAVIVTGASSGIGRALAIKLSAEGAWLALGARDADRLGVLARECSQSGGRAIAIPTDVTQEAQCRAMVERAATEFGRLDMLVNNAGITMSALLEEMPNLVLFQRVMAVNFFGALYCTYYAIPYLKQWKGRLVNVSSLAGIFPLPYNTPYNASKFALNGFSESLRMEVKRYGISLTVICPYWVVSELHERSLDKEGNPRGPRGRKIYTSRTMTSERCAQIILEAARRRKRQVVMMPGPPAAWLKLLAPGLLDTLILKVVFEPMQRRAKQKKD